MIIKIATLLRVL